MREGQEIPSFWNVFVWKEKIHSENNEPENLVRLKKLSTFGDH